MGFDTKIEDGTCTETYDVLIDKIRECDPESDDRYELLHLAEDMLMESGSIVPLYYDTNENDYELGTYFLVINADLELLP